MTTYSAGRTASDLSLGSTLAGRYLIEEVLGRGGMSTVYRASDSSLGRTVALKVFRADLADADDLRRQRTEIQLLARLNHSTLVTLFDAVTDDADRVALVLEYVEGRDLRDELAAGVLDRHTAAMIGADVADALAYIHARGIVHRDLKPGNLLIPVVVPGSMSPRAKLTDFGIARIIDSTHLTSAGSMIGTVGYLSPEQAMGGSIGAPSDVYSLGLVLLECLTGSRAFGGTGVEAIAARISRDPEIPPSLGPEWVEVLARMTRRDPDARPGAAEASLSLRAISVGVPAADDRATPSAPARTAEAHHPADDLATAAHAIGGDADENETTATMTAAMTPAESMPATTTETTAPNAPTRQFAPSHPEQPGRAEHLEHDARDKYDGHPTAVFPAYPGSDAPTECFAAPAHEAPPPVSAPGRVSERPTPPPSPSPSRTQQSSAAPTAAATPDAAEPARGSGTGTRRRAPRRRLMIVAAVIVLFGIGTLIGALVVQGSAGRAEVPPVDYPVVEGDLGDHLEQLQRSIEP